MAWLPEGLGYIWYRPTLNNMLRQTFLPSKLFAKVAFRGANGGFSKFSEVAYTHIKRKAEEKRSFTELAILNGDFFTCDDLILQSRNVSGFQCVLWSTSEFGRSFKDFPGHLERLSSCSFQGSCQLQVMAGLSVFVLLPKAMHYWNSFLCLSAFVSKNSYQGSLKYLLLWL